MKYSVLSFKSTRGFKLLEDDLSWPGAVESLGEWYEKSRTFWDHGLMASGVAIMITTQEDAESLVQGYTIPFFDKVLYQAGSC